MNLNRIGKYMLGISLPFFVFLIGSLLISENLFDILPDFLKTIVLIFAFISFCVSFAFIFYHSTPGKRKRATRSLAAISISVFFLGWVFKFMHWPGAAIAIMTASFLFSFGALPLIIKSRYEKRKTLISQKTSMLSFADMVSIALIIIGSLCRTMHWPGGNYVIAAGLIVLVITFVFWNVSFRKEVKLRLVAEEKLKVTLNEVEEKNKEITDSITYAKRIQEAILPSFDFIKEHLPEVEIYYQPKDIVAGDFYWAEKIGETFYIAAADCTGHGVPGALVSVVCSNALNRSVKEFKITEPGAILDKTRELVLESFSKSGGDIKDGMDISLLSVKRHEVKWAGANNPLWYIAGSDDPAISAHMKQGEQKYELKEIKANKQPIGKTDGAVSFTTHSLNLCQGDRLYLFTDGYADQFGGPKGKKFKYKQFEELLISSKELPLNEQFTLIIGTLNKWKQDLDQVDDICIIGIRL